MEQLRLNLINVINESGLPLEAVLFVVRDVYRDVNETFKNISEATNVASDENKEEE